jgi:thiamine biosynthesis lipoprotein
MEKYKMRILSIRPAVAVALALALAGSSVASNSKFSSRDRIFNFSYDNVLGTSLDLKVAASSQTLAHKAETAVLNEIAREANILSSWDPNSEFSRWARTHEQAVRVSPELFQVLGMYDQWRARTNGALDASAQSVILVWQAAAKANRVPSKDELASAVAKTRGQQWTLDASARTATHTGDAALVLASFTKSYIIDHAAEAAMHTGVNAVVVNIGGDLAVRGSLAEPVDIADPRAPEENAEPVSRILVHDLAVATSGDYRRGVEIAGQHYSHIVDPRTGMPAENIISSTVVAPNPADAGALATAFSILTPEESAKLAASIPGVSYLLVRKNGQQVKSDNWGALEAPLAQIEMAAVTKPATTRVGMAAAAPTGPAWDPSMELTIDFEIAQPRGMAKRPFVAAWVEDGDRFQVKTIAVWFKEDRYLTEMKAWYRSDRVRAMAEGREILRTVSGATRGAGKYSLKWDGKDNDGKPVKAGKYTVYLEVAREHGTYQLMKQEMDFSGTQKMVQFPANTEVAAASFDYHKLTGK